MRALFTGMAAGAALLMAVAVAPAQLNPPLGGGAPQQGAPAQRGGNPLVGVWSTQMTDTRGHVTGTMFTSFSADGRFSQRQVVRGATIDYVGQYQLSADRGALQSIYRDFSPKQDCRYGACYPVTPVVQMNTPYTTYIRWVRDNLFMTEDAGGQMRWIRQQ